MRVEQGKIKQDSDSYPNPVYYICALNLGEIPHNTLPKASGKVTTKTEDVLSACQHICHQLFMLCEFS